MWSILPVTCTALTDLHINTKQYSPWSTLLYLRKACKKSVILLLLLLLLIGVRCARPGESENTISLKTPTRHNQSMEGRKRYNSRRQKERADHANRKALALLLKPASPTPSNTGSQRSSQRDTERGTKLLGYWEVLQGGERVPMSNQSNKSNTRRHIRQRQCTA